jgi:hypothetical protein
MQRDGGCWLVLTLPAREGTFFSVKRGADGKDCEMNLKMAAILTNWVWARDLLNLNGRMSMRLDEIDEVCDGIDSVKLEWELSGVLIGHVVGSIECSVGPSAQGHCNPTAMLLSAPCNA